MSALSDRLSKVVGDRTATALNSGFGIETVEDLLRHYPRRYVVRGELSDISELIEGEDVTVLAEIAAVKVRRATGRIILEVSVTDGSAFMSLTFFNQAWREKELKVGRTGMFAGKVGSFNGKRQLSHPEYELIPDGDDVDSAVSQFAGKFLPVYPATGKMPSWKIAKSVELVLDSLDDVPDYLPPEVKDETGYPTLREALMSIHNPDSLEAAELARARLTFDEALLLQLLLAQRRNELRELVATPRKISTDGLVAKFVENLPYKFTQGQNEINNEIDGDLQQSHPMHRLLQGEVGSGKTVVALRAMLSVIESGGQGALLAPTEVLAAQHFKTITKLLGEFGQVGTLQGSGEGTSVALLTGSMSAAVKRETLAKIAGGDAGIVIGTHALISDGVEFNDLALVVVDEQHRFGVEQRDALRMKAKLPPHLLVMTATPIPRTVAMTIFGDLDISTLRQLPSGRTPIVTHVIPVLEKPKFLERAWERVREEVAKGHQAYVVAPRIYPSDDAQAKVKITDADIAMARLMGDDIASEELAGGVNMTSVEELAPQLATGPLAGLKVALLHGKLTTEDKEAAMNAFSAGEIDVLVATTVIEVGVDVPNASMMVIMDADRFGVSQLHQLRGRVGRGGTPGLCLLVSSAPEGSPAMARLNAVSSTLDGFELSRIDLDQRSEGDVLGSAQSGTKSHLRLLRVLRDEALIESARATALKLLAGDNKLTKYPVLAGEIANLKAEASSTFIDKG
jgi:ATP-dependent DNA helicase RecG